MRRPFLFPDRHSRARSVGVKPKVYVYDGCSTCRHALKFLQEHGMLDLVVPRRELRTTLQSLIKVYNLAYSQFERYRNPEIAREVAYAG